VCVCAYESEKNFREDSESSRDTKGTTPPQGTVLHFLWITYLTDENRFLADFAHQTLRFVKVLLTVQLEIVVWIVTTRVGELEREKSTREIKHRRADSHSTCKRAGFHNHTEHRHTYTSPSFLSQISQEKCSGWNETPIAERTRHRKRTEVRGRGDERRERELGSSKEQKRDNKPSPMIGYETNMQDRQREEVKGRKRT
jgi:hypothetical protein